MEIKKGFPIDCYPGFGIFSPKGIQFMTAAGKETDLKSVHELIHKVADVINASDTNNATAAITMVALLCANLICKSFSNTSIAPATRRGSKIRFSSFHAIDLACVRKGAT